MMRHHSESCLILKEKEVSTVMIPEVEELVAKYDPLESQFYQVLLSLRIIYVHVCWCIEYTS